MTINKIYQEDGETKFNITINDFELDQIFYALNALSKQQSKSQENGEWEFSKEYLKKRNKFNSQIYDLWAQ